jgi:glucosamine-6-phosphate deaminase
MYAELIRCHRDGLDLSGVRTFNMDEYIGLPVASPHSYRGYMFREFFNHVNVPDGNIHIPCGHPPDDLAHEAERYEESIRKAGGLDLQITGIGVNGHIGFNEPGSEFTSRTRVVELAETTLAGMRQYFGETARMPRRAITIGMRTILDARRIVLLASGTRKAEAVAKALQGPVTTAIPASALQLHNNVTVILDRDAAAGLLKS